jgi:hypothetical protein
MADGPVHFGGKSGVSTHSLASVSFGGGCWVVRGFDCDRVSR